MQNALTLKQPTGDYATNTALNNGLAGKAVNGHGHDYNSLSGKPAIPMTPNSSNFMHLSAGYNIRLYIPAGGTWAYYFSQECTMERRRSFASVTYGGATIYLPEEGAIAILGSFVGGFLNENTKKK